MTEEEEGRAKIIEQVSSIVRKMLVSAATVGDFSLKDPNVVEAFCEGLQREIDWLRQG